MAEVEKLLKAKFYCEKLANGIDPISDKAMPFDTVLNQVQLARLFFFLTEYIGEELKPTRKSRTSPSKLPFLICRADLSSVEISPYPISISEFSRRVNEHVQEESRQFSHNWPIEWLLTAGFLIMSESDSTKLPTDAGKKIGISNETRKGQYKEYRVTLYNKDAQQFLIDNMDSILAAQGYSILP